MILNLASIYSIQAGGAAAESPVLLYLIVLFVALSAAGAILWHRLSRARRRALEARLAELTAFADIGQAILGAPLDLQRLAESVYRQAGQIVDTGFFQLGLFDGDRYRLLIWIVDGEARPAVEFRLTPGLPGIVGWMRQSRRSLLVGDFEAERETLPAKPRYVSADPPRSGVFVPLVVGESVVGAMAIQSRKPGAFSEEDLRLLSIVANHAAAALQNGRLLEQAQRRATQLELLAEVSRHINALQPLPALYRQLVDLVAGKFQEYEVSFFEREADVLRLRATSRPDWADQPLAFEIGEGAVGRAALACHAVLAPELPEYPPDTSVGTQSTARAELAVPLEIGGRVLGVLDVHSRAQAAFDETAASVFNSLAAQMAIAILEAQTYAAEQRRSQHLAAIAQATRAVTSTLDLDDLLDEVIELITGPNFGYKRAHIYLAHDDQLVCRACTDDGGLTQGMESEGLACALDGAGLIALVGRTRQPLLVGEMSAHADYAPGPDSAGARSLMAAPMVMGPHLLGVFDVQSEEPEAFSRDDLQTLQTLAGNLAVAVRNARLFAAERRRRRMAEIMREVSAALTSTVQLDALLDLILDGLARVVSYDAASILLVNERSELCLRAARGVPEAEAAMGRALDVLLFLPDESYPATLPFTEVDHRGEYHKLLALPDPHACLGAVLAMRGQHLGYLVVDYAGRAHFPAEEVALIATFASQAAVAIENATLYQSQLEEAWVNTVLLQVAEALAGEPTLEEGLAKVARIALMLAGVEKVAIYQWETLADSFRLSQAAGLDRSAVLALSLVPVALRDLAIEPYPGDTLAIRRPLPERLAQAFGAESCMVWPLRARGDLLGALLVQQTVAPGQRTSILNGIAHHLTLAMEDARLSREVTAQQRLERELEVARDIQASFLPETCPQVAGWELSAFWRAARQVGGDFYDFIPLRADAEGVRWGLVVADVADKGVPAALFMALSRTLLRTMAINHVSPAATLARVNELILADARAELFVTVFYGVWESATGLFRYAVGGHNPPIHVDALGHTRALAGHGVALGVFDEVRYEEHEICLQPGEVLLLFTDGLPDAVNAANEEFGMERILEVLRRAHTGAATAIQEALVAAAQAHVGPVEAFDDMTLVVLKRAPSA